MTEPSVLAWQQRKRQEEIEYGTYRAVFPLRVDDVIVAYPGAAVPIANVKKFGWDRDGLVERVDGQPLDAPLPAGYVLERPEEGGAGWNDSPDGALQAVEQAPAGPEQGQTIEVDGQPAAEQPGS